jgi:hypothetical protein
MLRGEREDRQRPVQPGVDNPVGTAVVRRGERVQEPMRADDILRLDHDFVVVDEPMTERAGVQDNGEEDDGSTGRRSVAS